MIKITETVKHLLIINILMFFATKLLEEPLGWDRMGFSLFYPTSDYFEPYQIVTHMFMHADFNHLFFNMFGLFFFGPALESYWGSKKFLFYYLATGLGAMLIQLSTTTLEAYLTTGGWGVSQYYHSLGASGSIFGLLLAYGMIFPNNIIGLIIPPVRMKAKYMVIIFGVLELVLGLSGLNTGIGHFAHLGGALTGFFIILFWRKGNNRW